MTVTQLIGDLKSEIPKFILSTIKTLFRPASFPLEVVKAEQKDDSLVYRGLVFWILSHICAMIWFIPVFGTTALTVPTQFLVWGIVRPLLFLLLLSASMSLSWYLVKVKIDYAKQFVLVCLQFGTWYNILTLVTILSLAPYGLLFPEKYEKYVSDVYLEVDFEMVETDAYTTILPLILAILWFAWLHRAWHAHKNLYSATIFKSRLAGLLFIVFFILSYMIEYSVHAIFVN